VILETDGENNDSREVEQMSEHTGITTNGLGKLPHDGGRRLEYQGKLVDGCEKSGTKGKPEAGEERRDATSIKSQTQNCFIFY